MTDTKELIARLRLGASISRERKLNQGYDVVADDAADALEALQAEVERLNGELTLRQNQFERAIHMEHCFQPPYETSCKYGDFDCPAQQAQPELEIPQGALQQSGPFFSIGRKWIAYAQSTGDNNDIAVAVWSAIKEVQQAQPERAPLGDAEISRHWTEATIELCSHENCYKRGFKDAERLHGIKQGGQQ